MLDGWWTDAGTIGSLLRASRLVAEGGGSSGREAESGLGLGLGLGLGQGMAAGDGESAVG
jgi:hypothetical protein